MPYVFLLDIVVYVIAEKHLGLTHWRQFKMCAFQEKSTLELFGDLVPKKIKPSCSAKHYTSLFAVLHKSTNSRSFQSGASNVLT